MHLFEWRWADIALECEHYLAPNGFGGVKVCSFLPTGSKIASQHLLNNPNSWNCRQRALSNLLVQSRDGDSASLVQCMFSCRSAARGLTFL